MHLVEIDERYEVKNRMADTETRQNPKHEKHDSDMMQDRNLRYIHLFKSQEIPTRINFRCRFSEFLDCHPSDLDLETSRTTLTFFFLFFSVTEAEKMEI